MSVTGHSAKKYYMAREARPGAVYVAPQQPLTQIAYRNTENRMVNFVGPKRASTAFDPLEKSIGPFELKLHGSIEQTILSRLTQPTTPEGRKRSP